MRGLERGFSPGPSLHVGTLHNASSQICVTYLCLGVLRVRNKKKRGQWKRKRGRTRFGKRIVEVKVKVEVCLQTAFLFEAPATVAMPSKPINVLTSARIRGTGGFLCDDDGATCMTQVCLFLIFFVFYFS